MIQDKHTIEELLNSDDTDINISPKEVINMENIRYGTTNKGAATRGESIGSNALVTNSYLPNTGTNITIGSVEDQARGRLISFNWNSGGLNGIYCYDGTAYYKVILDAQIIGGLGFSKSSLIHSASVVGDLLYWTDGLNEPKKLNIEAGIKTNHAGYTTTVLPYATPLKYTTQTLIKRPPIMPCAIAKVYDSGYANNFIADNAFQVTYRFQYRDYEYSAFAAYSHLSSLNFKSDTFNKLNITIPLTEYIDDDIQQIDLCVKLGNFGHTFIIKSWNKTADATAITNHNAGTTALSYGFYNDTNGTAVDDVSASTSFHLVPLTSQCLAVARNRVFLGNNLLGYDTPASTSLSLALGTFNTGGGTFSGTWKYMTLQYHFVSDPNPADFSFLNVYYAYAPSCSPSVAFYYAAYQGTYPASVNYTDSDANWNSEVGLASYIQRNNIGALPSGAVYTTGAQAGAYYQPPTFNANGTHAVNILTPSTAVNTQFFKSNSKYQVSIAFYDQFRRKCGVVNQFQSVTIPSRTYNQSTFNAIINWTLPSGAQTTEIPSWAYYYQIHISKNQTTRFFLQTNIANAAYFTKNATTGVISSPVQGTYASMGNNVCYATGFDITPMFAFGYGYTYNVGDELVFYKSDGSAAITLPIIGTNGNFVLCKPTDIGDLTTVSVSNLIEIYTPYKPSVSEPLYETGAVYAVTNPTLNTRAYSTLTDQINGDCYAIQRNAASAASPNYYYAEAMSPNDKYWQIWQTDTGWINAIDTVGQKLRSGNIIFSDTFIPGSKVNGLNVFQPLNSSDVPSENDAINKLQLSSKIEDAGTVMLAISGRQTTSIYLGESQLVSSSGNAFLASSPNVIGTMNTLKGSFGTVNPESVIEYRGDVFWFDAKSGCFVMYSVNGVENISNYKAKRFSKLFANKYLTTPAATIEGYGSRPFVFGGIDVYHEEVMWSIPQVEATNPNGNLVDYSSPSRPYPYDYYDGMACTIVFKKFDDKNRWMGKFTMSPEFFGSIGSDCYTFKSGNAYIQNQSGFNNFFGVQYLSRVMIVSNVGGNVVKSFEGVRLDSNMIPTFSHFRSEYPFVQSTDLQTADWANKEGVFYSPIMRDRLSPNISGSYDEKVYATGDKMRTVALRILMEFDCSTSPLNLNFIQVAFIPSTGHTG